MLASSRATSGIAEQHLGHREGGGVALVGGLQVFGQHAAQRGQLGGEVADNEGGMLGGRQVVRSRRQEEQVAADLFGECGQSLRQGVADEIINGFVGEVGAAIMAGEEGGHQPVADFFQRRARGQLPHRAAMADFMRHLAREA
jgi:hypothetical protein